MIPKTGKMINHQLFVNLLPNIWENLVGLKTDWVFVAAKDIRGTLLVDMRPHGCFIFEYFMALFYRLKLIIHFSNSLNVSIKS